MKTDTKFPNKKSLPLILSLILASSAISYAQNDPENNSIYFDKDSAIIVTPTFNGFAGQKNSADIVIKSTPKDLAQIAGYISGDNVDSYYAHDNTLTLESGSATSIYAAYIIAKNSHVNAYDNEVIIMDNVNNQIKEVFGSYATTDEASVIAANNAVYISDSTIKGHTIAGSYALSRLGGGETMNSSNTIAIDGSTIESNIYGAINVDARTHLDDFSWHSASSNDINIYDSKISGNIFGAHLSQAQKKEYTSASLQAQDNTVTLYNTSLSGNIYGSYIQSAVVNDPTQVHLEAIDNTVIITGDTKVSQGGKLTSIYGGFIDFEGASFEGLYGDIDAFSGNHFVYEGNHSLRLGTLANFEKYTFYLNADLHKDPIITADTINLTGDTYHSEDGEQKTLHSTIRVAGIKSGKQLNIGDQFILMHAGELIGEDSLVIDQLDDSRYLTRALQGFSFVYDLGIQVDLDSKTVSATIVDADNPVIPPIDIDPVKPFDPTEPVEPGGKVNPQLKSLSEAYLAGAAFTNKGVDLLVNDILSKRDTFRLGGLHSLAAMNASYSRYNSGSHIKSKDFNMLLGSALTFYNNLTIGAFLEGGKSSYDTYNTFKKDNDVRGKGDSNFYGLGLFTQYRDSHGLFSESSLRIGKSKTDYTSDTFVSGDGVHAHYKVKPSYIGIHVGGGYQWNYLNNLTLNVTGRYFYSEVKGKDFNLGDDPIHFDKVKSSRVRVSAGIENRYTESTTLFADLGYEYEMNGKVDGTTHAVHVIDSPSIKGGSALLSLGINYVPVAAKNLTFNANLEGYAGKRRGGSLGLKFTYFYQQDAP